MEGPKGTFGVNFWSTGILNMIYIQGTIIKDEGSGILSMCQVSYDVRSRDLGSTNSSREKVRDGREQNGAMDELSITER